MHNAMSRRRVPCCRDNVAITGTEAGREEEACVSSPVHSGVRHTSRARIPQGEVSIGSTRLCTSWMYHQPVARASLTTSLRARLAAGVSEATLLHSNSKYSHTLRPFGVFRTRRSGIARNLQCHCSG